MPAERYYRRGHWVNRRRPKKPVSAWGVAAVIAVVAAIVVQGQANEGEQETPPPSVIPASAPPVDGGAP